MEFSKYGKHSEWVKKLVNKDIDAETFFENITGDIPVSYHQSFDETLTKLGQEGIFVTRIYTTHGYHSIFFYVTRNKTIYLYDPNGDFISSDPVHYVHGQIFNSTKDFQVWLQDRIGHAVVVPDRQGIQTKIVSKDNGYIHGGGYCMFFNYIAIQYLQAHPRGYYTLTREPEKVFPPMAKGDEGGTMEERTEQIVSSILGFCILRF